jgi:hypothetical protein
VGRRAIPQSFEATTTSFGLREGSAALVAFGVLAAAACGERLVAPELDGRDLAKELRLERAEVGQRPASRSAWTTAS